MCLGSADYHITCSFQSLCFKFQKIYILPLVVISLPTFLGTKVLGEVVMVIKGKSIILLHIVLKLMLRPRVV